METVIRTKVAGDVSGGAFVVLNGFGLESAGANENESCR